MAQPTRRLLSGTYSFSEGAERLGVSLAQAYRLYHSGTFPVPVLVLGKTLKLRVAEVEAFLQGSAPDLAPGAPEEVPA